MASTINSDNGVVSGTSGLKSTADTSGVLALQSNGTTGLTLNTSLAIGVGSGNSTGTSGQLLTSAGSGAAPTWTTVAAPSTSGGATVTNPMSANITLTSSSNRLQVMTPSAFGYSISLPDATTIGAAGGPIFILKNSPNVTAYPIKVLDSAGTNIGWVVPDYDTQIYLTSTAAATGNWVIETGNVTADGGIYPYGNNYANLQSTTLDYWAQNVAVSSNVAFSSNATSLTTRQWNGINSNVINSYTVQQYSESVYSNGAPNVTNTYLLRLSDTKIIRFWNSSASTLSATVSTLLTNGTQTSYGSQTTVATSYYDGGFIQPFAISATSILLVYHHNSANFGARILTISNNSISLGTAIVFGGGAVYSGTASLLSSSLATVIDTNYGTAYSLGISGTTVTNNGSTSVSSYGVYGVFTLSSTENVLIYTSNNSSTDVYAKVITNTGSGFTAGTGVLLFNVQASLPLAVSQLNTGLGVLVQSASVISSIQCQYFIVAVSGGVPYIKSQGLLPSNISQSQYFYPVNGTCVLQTNISSTSAGTTNASTNSFQKCVITGAS